MTNAKTTGLGERAKYIQGYIQGCTKIATWKRLFQMFLHRLRVVPGDYREYFRDWEWSLCTRTERFTVIPGGLTQCREPGTRGLRTHDAILLRRDGLVVSVSASHAVGHGFADHHKSDSDCLPPLHPYVIGVWQCSLTVLKAG